MYRQCNNCTKLYLLVMVISLVGLFVWSLPAGNTIQAQENTWKILKFPDSGQTTDYTNTLGEDSDYLINPPSYTDNADGTITDGVTGLMWQQSDGGEMTWDNAVTYCNNLSLGDQEDWRMPNSQELFTIIDHDSINPAFNTTYFMVGEAAYWWSSTERVDDSARAWVINSGGGIGPHPKAETVSAGGDRLYHILCVRGGTAMTGDRFTDNQDGTVTDNYTTFIWQQRAGEPQSWESALTYCENLSLAGHEDWRLPNAKSLRSINDDSLAQPSLNSTYFPEDAVLNYWSSTTLVNDTTQSWLLQGGYGLVGHEAKTTEISARCVRGGSSTSNVYIYLPMVIKNGTVDGVTSTPTSTSTSTPINNETVTPTSTSTPINNETVTPTLTSTSTPTPANTVTATTTPDTTTDFTLTSIAVSDGELLEAYKCEEKVDGVEKSIPLAWSNVPASTGSLAVIMHHYPNPNDTTNANSYLLLWGIDPSVTAIPHGEADDGSWFMGANKDGNAVSYTSPCSPSAGSHEYTITLYALSGTPSSLPTESTIAVDYEVLKSAIETVTVIDTAVLTFNDVNE